MIAAAAAEFDVALKLLEDGTVNAVSLAQARRESEALGIPLIEVLVARDWVGESALAQKYADLGAVRFLDLSRRRPSPEWAVTLPENIARRKDCIVYGEVAGVLVVAVADPIDPAVRAAVERHFDRKVQFVVSPRYQIRESIDEIYPRARSRARAFETTARPVQAAPRASAAPSDAEIVRLAPPAALSAQPSLPRDFSVVDELTRLLDEAVNRRASDIHLEPESDRFRVRYRIDGILTEVAAFPPDAAAPLISRLKVLSNLDITERRKPQDGRFRQRSFDQDIDVRVAVIPTARGERVTLRLLLPYRATVDFEALGMGLELRPAFEKLIHRSHGIILLTGPTGSGKTTTLYVALQAINSVERHIITIEDPVEYDIPGVNQVAVDAEHGVSFSLALRSILRHNPDVIMVGEIRDAETAHLAIEASLTGHLVFATLHTGSAAGAVTRLLDMGCEPYLVASALIGVMAQRLVRKICPGCRKAVEPTDAERRLVGLERDRSARIFRGTGCSRCLKTGYFDRVGVFEFIPFDAKISDLVIAKATTEEIQQHAARHGALLLRDDAMAKVRDGLTSLEEAMRVLTHDDQ